MAQIRFLDQVPVGVYQSTSTGGGTIDIYQNGILISSSVPYINFSGSVQLSSFNTTGVTVYISGSSGGGSGNGFPFSGSAVITGSLIISGSNPFVVFGLGQNLTPNQIVTYNTSSGLFSYTPVSSLVSGTSGTSGTSGASGSSGTSGSSGSSGTSGASGSSGTSGNSGTSGSSGSSGSSGTSGSSGSSGTSGNSGTSGSSGSSGTSGISGSSGSSGTSGNSGSSGTSGADGSSGTSGSSGSSGTSGLSGSSGSSGTSGVSGSSGSSGTSGLSGSSGTSGTSGASQNTGSLLTTASVSLNTITFTKGDGSTFPITVDTGSGGGSGGTGIFVQSGSTNIFNTTSSLKITGSTLQAAGAPAIATTASQAANNYAMVVSQSGWFYNHNAGVPTSNAWGSGLSGSYFNNFTSNTDVSEILRFVSGLLSSSAPDASPNTKTYSTTLTENQLNTGQSTAPAGYVPSGSTNTDIIYLTSKGFAPSGSTLFAGKTIYSTSTFSSNYSSLAAGSTTISSSVNAQLFGLGPLTSGGPTQFNVSGTVNFFYSDNNLETSTATSQSENLLSQASFATTNGLTLAKINTSNPAVIPAAYQDGLFTNVYTSSLYNGGRTLTSVSASGWYHISASIKIASGSSAYSVPAIDTTRIFYSPIASLTIPNNTLYTSGSGNVPLTATSRSLSGAPYLLTATWNFSSSVSGTFNPLYASSTTVADVTVTDAASLTTVSGTTAASTNGGTVQTTNAVFDSTGVTARVVGTIPFQTDIIKLTGSATFNAGSAGAENINQSGLGTITFTLNTNGRIKDGTQSTLLTQTLPYIQSGSFGQPVGSGSMAYYGRAQGYDGGTLTGTTELFSGETYRIKITDLLLSGSYTYGTKFITASYDAYNLGALDLQVKPGFLVKPSSSVSNGYWLANPSEAQTYKYYARAFQTNGTAYSVMTINVGQTLTSWTGSANNAVSALIMFSSSVAGTTIPSSGGSTLSRAVLFDPSALSNLSIATNQANDNFLNPFTTAIDIKGNNQGGSGLVGTTYTIPLTDTLNQILTSAYKDLIIMIRYNGQPTTPISSITVSFS